jgi:molecular chaperone GrpE (heat shock protein)
MELFGLKKNKMKEEDGKNERMLEDLTGRLMEKLQPLLTESIRNIVTAPEHSLVKETPAPEITPVAEPENDAVKPADEPDRRVVELDDSLKIQLDRIEKRLQELAEKTGHVPAVTPPQGSGGASIAEIETKLSGLESNLKKLLEEIGVQVQDFTYKDKINRELHEELLKYRAGLRKEFITPLLKSIIREYDRADKQYQFHSKANSQNELLREFEIVSLSLLELLSDYDVSSFHVEEGTAFSVREHKIAEGVETDNATLDGKVASCKSYGFRDAETGRILRLAEVNIYRKK